MNNGQVGWLVLCVFAIMLIIIGIQGNVGIATAILFCPKYVTLTDGGGAVLSPPPSSVPSVTTVVTGG